MAASKVRVSIADTVKWNVVLCVQHILAVTVVSLFVQVVIYRYYVFGSCRRDHAPTSEAPKTANTDGFCECQYGEV